MTLKIGRYTFDNITNKDWILDNDVCYQCMTLKHMSDDGSRYHIKEFVPTIMSKKLFKQLVREGKIVRFENFENSEKFKRYYAGCKAWRFNVGNEATKNE